LRSMPTCDVLEGGEKQWQAHVWCLHERKWNGIQQCRQARASAAYML